MDTELSGVEQELKQRPTGHRSKHPSYKPNCAEQCILPSNLDPNTFITTRRLV